MVVSLDYYTRPHPRTDYRGEGKVCGIHQTMHTLPSASGCTDYREEGGSPGSPSNTLERRQHNAELIAKANTVSLPEVMHKYGFHIDGNNRKITCPFKFHSNGNERTSSFWYYPDTNSFYCFGCKSSRSPTDFVALYENIARCKAATKIIEAFGSEVSDDWEVSFNSQEQQEIVVAFCDSIRTVITDNPNALEQIEAITEAFDMLNEKYQLDIEGTKKLISKMQERLDHICSVK